MNDRILTVTAPEDIRTVFCFWEKRHLKDKGSYIRIFQDVLRAMARDRDLNLTDHRVFLCILSEMEFENHFKLSQTEIGEMIEVDRANISRSLQKLEARGFIVCIALSNRKKVYVINPHIAFKTKSKDLKQLENDWEYLTSQQDIQLSS